MMIASKRFRRYSSNMSVYYLVSCFISLLVGVVTYLSTSNLIFTGIGLFISFIYFFLAGSFMVKRYLTVISRFHECYSFLNTFIVSLSIKESLKYSFDATFDTMPDSFKKNLVGIEDLNVEEKINYLSKYFKFHIYGLFIRLITLWSEQGGDILDMSSYLINQARLIEEYISESTRLARKNIFEFAVLWLFSLSIIVILRFALANFYEQIIKQTMFPISILIVIILLLLTTHIAITRLCHMEIRGWEDAK